MLSSAGNGALVPWKTIWTQPGATMQRLLETGPERGMWLPCLLVGTVHVFTHAHSAHLGQGYLMEQFLPLCVLASPFVGLLHVLFWGWLLRLTGRWFRGTGTAQGLRAAVAWALLPIGSLAVLWWALIARFGAELFQLETPYLDSHPGDATYFQLFMAVAVLMALWSLYLLVHTVAAAHSLTQQKAIQCLAVTVVAFLGPVLLSALIVSLAPGSPTLPAR